LRSRNVGILEKGEFKGVKWNSFQSRDFRTSFKEKQWTVSNVIRSRKYTHTHV